MTLTATAHEPTIAEAERAVLAGFVSPPPPPTASIPADKLREDIARSVTRLSLACDSIEQDLYDVQPTRDALLAARHNLDVALIATAKAAQAMGMPYLPRAGKKSAHGWPIGRAIRREAAREWSLEEDDGPDAAREAEDDAEHADADE